MRFPMMVPILAAALWTVAPAGAHPVAARGAQEDPVRPESRVWITGSSNIRRFTCRARGLSGSVALRADVTQQPSLAGDNVAQAPSLTVPFARLHCGIGVMNRHLRQTVRADAHPSVSFRLERYEATVAGDVPTVRLAGRLDIAGVAKPVVVDARLAADTSGVLHVQGVFVVRMTDFGITPPRRFGGLLQVRDRVAVHFDVVPAQDDDALDSSARRLTSSPRL
jgi:polyisoprenoid-binding protein YceI